MSGHIKTRSMPKGNEAMRGDASTTPDNPKYLRIEEERGHEVCATSQQNDDTNACIVVVSSFYGNRAEPEWFCIIRMTREWSYNVK